MVKEVKISIKNIIVVLMVLLVLFFIYVIVKSYLYGGRYVAVYLRTGDMYFGKLFYFPKLKLKDATLIQVDQDGQLRLSTLNQTFWNSEGYLILNKDNVVWISPIKKDSQFFQQLKAFLNQPQLPSVQTQQQTPNNNQVNTTTQSQ